MTIELPDKEVSALHLTPGQVRLELAVGLYAGRQVTLGRAAKVAGIPYPEFMHEVGRRGIPFNYTVADAQSDVETVRKMSPR